MESRVVVRPLNGKFHIAGNVEDTAPLEDGRDLVHFLDDLICGRLRDNGEAGVCGGAVCSLFRVGQRLTLQGFQPCGTVELFVYLLGAALGSVHAYGISDRRTVVEHTLDVLPTLEALGLLVQLAELFLESVHIRLIVFLDDGADFSLASADFCESFLDVHFFTSMFFVNR